MEYVHAEMLSTKCELRSGSFRIVQTDAAHFRFIVNKSARADNIKAESQADSEPYHPSGILRDIGLVESKTH